MSADFMCEHFCAPEMGVGHANRVRAGRPARPPNQRAFHRRVAPKRAPFLPAISGVQEAQSTRSVCLARYPDTSGYV